MEAKIVVKPENLTYIDEAALSAAKGARAGRLHSCDCPGNQGRIKK